MKATLHYISQGVTPIAHLDNISSACKNGASLVQLRLKNYDLEIIRRTALRARMITSDANVRLIINDYYTIAEDVKADGVHLGQLDTCPLEARKYLGNTYTIGGTANTLEQCKALLKKKVDYIGLGPYTITETKTNLSPILGVEGYKTIIHSLKTDVPIIAIGGIQLNDIPAILETGVSGIAMSKTITQNFKSIKPIQQLLKEVYSSKLQS